MVRLVGVVGADSMVRPVGVVGADSMVRPVGVVGADSMVRLVSEVRPVGAVLLAGATRRFRSPPPFRAVRAVPPLRGVRPVGTAPPALGRPAAERDLVVTVGATSAAHGDEVGVEQAESGAGAEP
jgi:hypothetical protein